jgi:hypothetical protein
MARMIAELMERPPLLQQHGVALFWGGWTALVRARGEAVGWSELAPLVDGLRRLTVDGPDDVRRIKTARAVRVLGVRAALKIRGGSPAAGSAS